MDILYGKHAVLEALRSGRQAKKLIFLEKHGTDNFFDEISALAERANIVIEYSNRQRLEDIAHNEHHQGIVGYFHTRVWPSLQEIIDITPHPGLFVVLDEVQDPHNLGALLRSSDAMGVHGIVLPNQRSVNVTPTVAKVAVGASEYVPVIQVPNISAALNVFKKAGYWCVGLAHTANKAIGEWDFTMPTVIVLGTEGTGMRQLTIKQCDELLRIPMHGSISSLNVAAAGAIVMYEAARQRSK